MTAAAAIPRSADRTTALASPLASTALARHVAAAVLLLAAVLKWQQAFAVADFGGFSALHKWGTIALVAGEVVLAFWLLCGVFVPVLRWVAVGVFAAFAGYNAWRWIGGYATCGCFGAVSIHPAITMLVDLGIIGLFLLSKAPPTPPAAQPIERRVALIATAAALALALPAAATMVATNPTRLTADGLAGGDRGAVRLEPDQWVGQRLPLLPYIENVDVGRGEWLVVLWHPHCGHCTAALPGIIDQAETTGGLVLLLNTSLDDAGDAVRSAVARVPNLHATSLDRRRRWSVATPQYLTVHDGRLTAVR